MLSCSFGTADSHKSSSCLHGHQHELCKHEEFLNWILLVIELCHLPNGARDTDFWVATRGAHLLMPVTRPLLNFATSCCGEICSSWASEQLPQQQRALILTSRAKQFCFGRMHSRKNSSTGPGRQVSRMFAQIGSFVAVAPTPDTATHSVRGRLCH